MQDLLTKGIDENGNIRSEETHKFKDSPLGRIPVEWEVSQLRDTGTWLSGGTPSKSEKTYWGPFVPWVCSKDMKVFDLKNTLEMITQKGVLSGSKVAPKDSVLIVVRGMILAHTFPVVYLTRDMAFNQDIKAIIPNENIYGRYLAYWFSANSSQLLKLTTTATHGTKRLETNDLLEFALCLPSKMEQKKIIYLLDKSQYDIEITKEYLQKLKLQKTGLMQDLLTGKVRVTDLLNQKTATN
jgi:type I restriction enzyme S subunit